MDNHTEMDTLTNRINYLKHKGYTEEFKIVKTRMQTADGTRSFTPEEVKITEHFRFEGDSDPGDMTVLYAIETEGGDKGVLIDAFGTYNDAEETSFIQKIEEMHKGNIY